MDSSSMSHLPEEAVVPDHFADLVGKLDPLAIQVLSFWFGQDYDGQTISPEAYQLWFGKSAETDLDITARFEKHLDDVANGKHDHWAQEPLGVVALLVLMDQFPRNIYRNTARAFAYDWKAIVIAQEALKAGFDDKLSNLERVWIYLVLTHTEDLVSQQQCVNLAKEKLTTMCPGFRKMWNVIFEKHLVVIEKFGRFPHRNQFLRRPSTPQESQFVNDPSYRFDLPVKLELDPNTGEAKFIFLGDGAGSEPAESECETEAMMTHAKSGKRWRVALAAVRLTLCNLDGVAQEEVLEPSRPQPAAVAGPETSRSPAAGFDTSCPKAHLKLTGGSLQVPAARVRARSRSPAPSGMDLDREVSAWISEITGECKGAKSMHEWLKSGRVLLILANKIKPDSVPLANTVATPQAAFKAFKERENISFFRKFMQNSGMKEAAVFQTADLYEGKNMHSFLKSMVTFASAVQTAHPDFVCPLLGPAR